VVSWERATVGFQISLKFAVAVLDLMSSYYAVHVFMFRVSASLLTLIIHPNDKTVRIEELLDIKNITMIRKIEGGQFSTEDQFTSDTINWLIRQFRREGAQGLHFDNTFAVIKLALSSNAVLVF
jgi:hypothetical protein